MLPIVSVVGRPNVGKSTLFNKFMQKRIAIVEDTPGVTRDRLYAATDWNGFHFMLVDTGGFVWDGDVLDAAVTRQAEEAVAESDCIIFVVDAKAGVTGADEELASILRKRNKPVLLAVNKVDSFADSSAKVAEFYGLGLGEPIPVSAANGLNIGDLLDQLVIHLEKLPEGTEDDGIPVAIIGRPNVGKSSLINRLSGSERSVVSSIPGTTRDAVDTRIVHDDINYTFIDTAGIRKKSRLASGVEYYSMLRSIRAVQRCEIALLVLDAVDGVTEQDKRIAGIAHEAGKAIIILVNKWDAVERDTHTMHQFREEIYRELKFLNYAVIEFISALTGARIQKLFPLIHGTVEQYNMRISTGLLNDLLNDALAANPPSAKGKKVRIYYGTQVGVKPPRFVLFCNEPEFVHFSYLRYLENRFREAFGFMGSPIQFILRKRGEKQ
ncbi:MAG: ribosome biogenesis GTPase Der [Firmicutes bacterium]|nr:ribosome biogenesis GTPase Der [Bacillota bacterium]